MYLTSVLNNQTLITKWTQAGKLMRAFCRHWGLFYGPHCSGSKKILPGDNTRPFRKKILVKKLKEKEFLLFFF